MADPRGRLFEDYVRIAKQLDVRWLVFENVRGLVTARGPDGVPGSALQIIRTALAKAGWQTRVDLLNAADFGVPQRRVRLLLLGYREGDAPPFPSPRFGESEDVFARPWVTLGQCISAIRPPSSEEVIRPSGKLASELAGLRPGSGVKSAGKRESTRPGGHWGYKQGAFVADLSKAARTVTANAQQDWIIDPALGLRRLSPRECAALQTFPPCWRFVGSRVDQYRLIGNAVPPKLAAAFGRALLEHSKKAASAKAGESAAPVPLPSRLQAAIAYTQREEARNGESRRAVAPKRRSKIAAYG
jgi:DNA (cytosine-5)-methyltransferase 1